jgi:hypothetical protein
MGVVVEERRLADGLVEVGVGHAGALSPRPQYLSK